MRERLRRRYRPACVRVLFVGEAPPASGRFFYQGDSGLYRSLRDCFSAVDASINDANFLRTFQHAGCYLIDLCGYAVDHLSGPARRGHCLANEPLLCRAIRSLEPPLIVIMLRAIGPNVARAAESAGWKGRILQLPYPGRWIRHRETFIAELMPEVRALGVGEQGKRVLPR